MNAYNIVLWICLSFALLSCGRSAPMTPSEIETMNALTSKLGVRCAGRYLIDMPGDVLTSGTAEVKKVFLEARSMTWDQYKDEVGGRADELKAMKHVRGYPFLLTDSEVRSDDARYFIHLESKYAGNIGRVIEAYKWSDGFRIKLETKAYDVTTSVEKDNPAAQEIGNNVPEKIELVLDMLERVRGRAEADVPTEPGVCFAGGFLKGPATDAESIAMRFVLRDMPDVNFSIETDGNIRESTTLLERSAQVEGALRDTGGRTIRKGRVDLAGLRAEEWLTAGMTSLEIQGHSLALEANSKIGSAQAPLVTLDMRNGAIPPGMDWDNKPTKASLTESEVIALWDTVSRTLRVRPNGF
jgi:hypothetical protein